ncbi:hypothetical protein PR048_013909 [Dryococelus australis]|uniref:Uncharacterized protein n=1 Tax=Dryococelus australis TaxID=614101 RepID=A0ABQ9HUF0_9NEOP|nr:hypothetical protein PR048_013909 [Dryococelus australis]
MSSAVITCSQYRGETSAIVYKRFEQQCYMNGGKKTFRSYCIRLCANRCGYVIFHKQTTMLYLRRKYAEMHYFYSVAQSNGHHAAALNEEHLLKRGGRQPERYPDLRMFINTHNTFMEGSMPGSRPEGIPGADLDHVDQVLEEASMNCLPVLGR